MDPNLPFQPPSPVEPVQPLVPAMPPMESVPVAPTPVPPPTKKTNWVLILGIVLLLVSVLALVGYYLYQSNQLRVSVPTPIVLTSLSPVATTDPTADWQTYTNPTFGLSFKYPSDYKITMLNGSINLQKDSSRALLYLSEFTNPKSLEISQWFESQPKEDIQPIKDTHVMTETILDGQKALKFTKVQPETGYKDFLIIVGNKTNVYYLNFGPLENEVDISNQILSTFKFTEVLPSPSSTPSSTPSATPTATPL